MAESPRNKRRTIWWVCGGLLIIVLVLIGYRLFNGPRIRVDPKLSASLKASEIKEVAPLRNNSTTWDQWRGARRDGVATMTERLRDWPDVGPKELWRVPGGHGFSSFAIRDGRIYTMVGNEGNQEVVALNCADGKRIWSRECGTSKPNDHNGADFGGPRATPTLDGDRLYTLSSWGLLLCLDLTTGEVIWKVDLVSELGGVIPRWGYPTSPLVEGDLVYVMPGGPDCAVAAFNKTDGKKAWSALSDVAGYSSPIAMTIAGVRQVVYYTGERVLGVAPKSGKLLWSFKWHDSFNVNAATPVPLHTDEGDYVFVSSGYKKGSALVSVKSDGSGGFTAKSVYQTNEVCCHFASPVLHGEYLYALDEAMLACVEVKTGVVRWRQRGVQKGSLIRVADRLIVLSERGRLTLVECDASQYREAGRCQPFESKCWTMPVVADGRLYLRDQSEIVSLELAR